MRRLFLLMVLASAVAAASLADTASAGCNRPNSRPRYRKSQPPVTSWHGWHYHSAWGMPLALLVPPTAELQTKWGWGVGNTQVVPIWPQFARDYPGPGQYDPRVFKPTPPWPSHTDQFGVYCIRGPW